MPFLEVRKLGGSYANEFPDNVIRILPAVRENKSPARRMLIATNVFDGRSFPVDYRMKDTGLNVMKFEIYRLSFQVNPVTKQIKIIRPSDDRSNFRFTGVENGGTVYSSLPRDFEKYDLPSGDYHLSENDSLVFTLAS